MKLRAFEARWTEVASEGDATMYVREESIGRVKIG